MNCSFRDVHSIYTTDNMQRVGVLCTPFDLNKKGVNTIDTLDCCSYYPINNMKKL